MEVFTISRCPDGEISCTSYIRLHLLVCLFVCLLVPIKQSVMSPYWPDTSG